MWGPKWEPRKGVALDGGANARRKNLHRVRRLAECYD